MADDTDDEDKTEEPSQRRLDQAIERGDVATSAEINTFAILGAFTLALVIAAPSIAQSLTQGLKAYLANAHTLPDDATAMKQAATRGLWLWLQAVAVPVGMAAAAGLAAGLLLAFSLGRTLESLLFGVAPTDAITFLAAASLLGVTALVACALPAWRASRVDPIAVLRSE